MVKSFLSESELWHLNRRTQRNFKLYFKTENHIPIKSLVVPIIIGYRNWNTYYNYAVLKWNHEVVKLIMLKLNHEGFASRNKIYFIFMLLNAKVFKGIKRCALSYFLHSCLSIIHIKFTKNKLKLSLMNWKWHWNGNIDKLALGGCYG